MNNLTQKHDLDNHAEFFILKLIKPIFLGSIIILILAVILSLFII